MKLCYKYNFSLHIYCFDSQDKDIAYIYKASPIPLKLGKSVWSLRMQKYRNDCDYIFYTNIAISIHWIVIFSSYMISSKGVIKVFVKQKIKNGYEKFQLWNDTEKDLINSSSLFDIMFKIFMNRQAMFPSFIARVNFNWRLTL